MHARACPRIGAGYFFGTLFLGAGLVVNQYAINFATLRASNSVTDLILSNIPVFDVDAIFVYGTAVAVAYTVVLFLCDPQADTLYAQSGGALFYHPLGVSLTLTHLAPFAPHIANDFGPVINRAFFGDDLFFSGHTGLPFLAALGFWDWPFQRYFYLGLSIFFGAIVLLGHYHYSIDVASAFFITYGIYDIAKWLFPKDYALFKSN